MKKFEFKFINKKGFTLAEVLITLSIIGVIAAMVIPSLVQDTKKAERSAGIKKAMSVLTDAYRMARLDNGTNFACTYLVTNGTWSMKRNECNSFWQTMKSKLNAIKSCDYNASGNNFGNCLPPNGIDDANVHDGCGGYRKNYQKTAASIVLQDGTYMYAYAGAPYPLFAYDVNGFKGPNKYGEDVFSFYIINYKIAPDNCNPGEQALDFLKGSK